MGILSLFFKLDEHIIPSQLVRYTFLKYQKSYKLDTTIHHICYIKIVFNTDPPVNSHVHDFFAASIHELYAYF